MIEAAEAPARKTATRADLIDRGEALVGLLRQKHVADDFLARDPVDLRLIVDLRFDQGRQDVAGTDGVAGDRLLRHFQRHRLGEADDAVLGRDIGRLEGRGDEAVGGGHVDDPPEPVPRA